LLICAPLCRKSNIRHLRLLPHCIKRVAHRQLWLEGRGLLPN
jgi:hypothetical protein